MVFISDIIKDIPFIRFVGNREQQINQVIDLTIDNQRADVLMWLNPKNISKLRDIRFGTIVCPEFDIHDLSISKDCNYIVVESPRQVFQKILSRYFVLPVAHIIHPTAQIAATAQIGENVHIGHHVVIEEYCSIGENSIIGHNTVILAKTQIGKNVLIGANNTIGGVGFGYEKNETGDYELIPHIGNVIIEDSVEIGNNTCIDRGVLRSTRLRYNCKIDNLVHIAHGVEVGQNSMIIAQAMLGGSTKIGDNVWVAPSAALMNKIQIGDNVVVGLGAVVVKSVEANTVVVGNPAKQLGTK